jgi:hypothetical protein
MTELTPVQATSPKSVGGWDSNWNIWWIVSEPTTIFKTTTDPAYHDPSGEHPGFWDTYSTDPDSANYNPRHFNRLACWLTDHGIAAPPVVPDFGKQGRLLRRRGWVAKQLVELGYTVRGQRPEAFAG